LDLVDVTDFEWKAWKLEKLSLKRVEFPQKEAFQNFVAFIKSLDGITELELDVVEDQRENGNNYSDVLTHLLNLPSLTKLDWKNPDISNLSIINPSITAFTIYVNDASIFHAFPNIQKLNLQPLFGEFRNETISAMNSLKQLREVILNSDNFRMMNCPQLKKFTIHFGERDKDEPNLDEFIKRHPNIEWLELHTETQWPSKYYIRALKNFHNLKTLKIYDAFGAPEPLKYFDGLVAVKFIGNNFGNLEHLELIVHKSIVEEAVQFLRVKFPQYGCDSKELKKHFGQNRGYWLLTMRRI
jgi:hypothetical protein